MEVAGFPCLSFLIFFPVVLAAALIVLPGSSKGTLKTLAFLGGLVELSVAAWAFCTYDSSSVRGGFVLLESLDWMPALGIRYQLGADGISLFLILLTALLFPLCVLSLGDSVQRLKPLLVCLLFEQAAITGTFASLDMFLFYVFWDAVLVPMYFIIGIWGGERRIYASMKFFAYTMLGSVLMLLAIFYSGYTYHAQTGVWSFSVLDWYQLDMAFATQAVLFSAFALAFAIKVPIFPFHTWLPDAHVEAPTVGSVILAGVLLKMGTYGFLRFAIPLFPDVAREVAPWMLGLGVIGVVYGALVAMVQPDVKKLVAYSSVSHLGFVIVGLFSFNLLAYQGSMLQMVNHGLSTGGLFFLVGMIYERRHTRLLDEFGGIGSLMPKYATLFLITTLSSIGLPALNGFIGEWNILLGSFLNQPIVGVLAGTGVVLGAWYLLQAVQKVFYGPIRNEANRVLRDLSFREVAVMAPLVALFVWIGLFPAPFLGRLEPSLSRILEEVNVPGVKPYRPAGIVAHNGSREG